jgi:single-strand DNA-binding protein
MKDFNKVILVGHLASDVEAKKTPSGKSVAVFPLAINRKSRLSTGEMGTTVDFHRVVTWGPVAETACGYLSKGKPVLVEGKIVNRSFDDKEGNKHFRTEVVAEEISFLFKKP